jgi:hypothetical protein
MKKSAALFVTVTMLGLAGMAGPASACDLCSIYRSIEARASKPGPYLGLFEQYTHFGTLQEDGRKVENEVGQKLDSSITQFIAGYQLSDRFGVQLNIPYIHRSFTRPEGLVIDRGTESGLGDLSLIGHYRAYQYLGEKTIFAWDLLGGIKFPTGDSDRLKEELSEEEPLPGAVESGIHGHDLALGSGSYDGIVGTSVFARWQRLFLTGGVQYTIRSRGDVNYRFANDLTWHVKPGAFLWLTEQGTVGLQLAVSGEDKGKDDLNGDTMPDTGITSVFIGPELSVTWKGNLSAELAAEFPVVNDNTALQIVPDYRIKAALTWRF